MDSIPGLHAHRPAKGSGLTKGAWYSSACHYDPEALDNLPLEKFVAAAHAENITINRLSNYALHTHPVYQEADIFNQGKPTAIAFGQRDVRQGVGALPVAESTPQRAFIVPRFVTLDKPFIDRFVDSLAKIVKNRGELLK